MPSLSERIRTTIYRRLVLVYVDLATLPAYEPGEDIECRWLMPDDADAYRSVRPTTARLELVERLRIGCRCAGLWHNGELTHFGWTATGATPATVDYFKSALATRERETLLFDTFTRPASRRAGHSDLRNAWVRITLAEEGVERIYALIAPENAASLAMVSAHGLEPIGTYHLLRLGPINRRWVEVEPGGERMPEMLPASAPSS